MQKRFHSCHTARVRVRQYEPWNGVDLRSRPKRLLLSGPLPVPRMLTSFDHFGLQRLPNLGSRTFRTVRKRHPFCPAFSAGMVKSMGRLCQSNGKFLGQVGLKQHTRGSIPLRPIGKARVPQLQSQLKLGVVASAHHDPGELPTLNPTRLFLKRTLVAESSESLKLSFCCCTGQVLPASESATMALGPSCIRRTQRDWHFSERR